MNLRKTVILFAGLAAFGLFFYFNLHRYLSLETLKGNREALVTYYADHKEVTIVAFMAVYITQTALSLPGATVLSLAAGAIFGSLIGTVCAVIAATIGATIAFLITRYLLRDAILEKFGSRLEGLNRELESTGLNYLLFLRLVPAFPFFLINMAAGLTRLPLRTFFFGTMLGIIPGAFVYVNAGASLAAISSLQQIASPRVVASFALLGLFALVPALYAKWRKRKNDSKPLT